MSSNHKQPIVPKVILPSPRTSAYALPPIAECWVFYSTNVNVKLHEPNGSQRSVPKTSVWCLPDDQAWERAVELYNSHNAALEALRQLLVALGRYPAVLAQAEAHKAQGLIRKVPNPVVGGAIRCPDPNGHGNAWNLSGEQWGMPVCEYATVTRHTAKNIEVGGSLTPSSNYTACSTPEDWRRVAAAYAVVKTTNEAWNAHLRTLHTYADADTRNIYQPIKPLKVPAPVDPNQMTSFDLAA